MAMTEGISTIELEHALLLGPFRTEIPPIPSPLSSVSRRHISSLDDLPSKCFIKIHATQFIPRLLSTSRDDGEE
ncbi:hypothetical protein FS842_009226 [Serendipita sp. 407]|nr:hypothetical protein FS842_009226 [Serendipita sp. 407]